MSETLAPLVLGAVFLVVIAAAATLARVRADRLVEGRYSSGTPVSNVRRWMIIPAAWGLVSLVLMTVSLWPGCRLPSDIGSVFLAGLVGAMASLILAGVLERLHRRGTTMSGLAWRIVLTAFCAWFAWGFLSSSMCGAINRGCQKRTMSDMRTLATAIEEHWAASGSYPTVDGTAEDLMRELSVEPSRALPAIDGWGHPFVLRSTALSYTIVSYGGCGEPDVAEMSLYTPGQTLRFRDDCVFSDGSFVRYPDGTQE